MRVLYLGTGWPVLADTIQKGLPPSCSFDVRPPHQPLDQALRGVDIALPGNARLDRGAIERAGSLRLIQQLGVGVDGIDLPAAKDRGIPVCNTPLCNPNSVAELALFLMLSLARRVHGARASFEKGVIGEPVGEELSGKVLGLIGRGKSGSILAGIAQALGMRVLAVTSKNSPEEFAELLASADFVSLHCPLTEKTRGLFDPAAFARMKPGSYLINCARAGLIVREALEASLASGHLGGVGMDVFWQEPWDSTLALFSDPRVVVTPHIGGTTQEAFSRIAAVVRENVLRLGRGEALLHPVDSAVR